MADESTIVIRSEVRDEGPQGSNVEPSAGEQLNRKSEDRSTVTDILQAIREGKDSPLNIPNQINDYLRNIRTGEDTPLSKGGGGGSGKPPNEPPIVPPGEGPAGAAEGAGIAIEGATEGLTGLGSTVVDVTALFSEFLPILEDGALVLTAFVSAVSLGVDLLSDTFHSLEKTWEDISGTIQAAKARQEVELIRKEIETEPQIQDETNQVYGMETSVLKELIEIKTSVVEIIAPILVILLAMMKVILFAFNFVLKFIAGGFEILTTILEYIEQAYNTYILLNPLKTGSRRWTQAEQLASGGARDWNNSSKINKPRPATQNRKPTPTTPKK